jgi:hypothetical protein
MTTISRFTLYIFAVFVVMTVVFGGIGRIPRAHAANYFGGMRTAYLTCTCSGNTLIYINNYASGGGSLALVYDGSARLYSHNSIFGTYLLGSYSPGGSCRIGEEPYCEDMDVDGSFDSNPGTGTSF